MHYGGIRIDRAHHQITLLKAFSKDPTTDICHCKIESAQAVSSRRPGAQKDNPTLLRLARYISSMKLRECQIRNRFLMLGRMRAEQDLESLVTILSIHPAHRFRDGHVQFSTWSSEHCMEKLGGIFERSRIDEACLICNQHTLECCVGATSICSRILLALRGVKWKACECE